MLVDKNTETENSAFAKGWDSEAGTGDAEAKATTPDPTEDLYDEFVEGVDTDVIVKNHVIAAMGCGLVPIPVVDMVSIAGVQLNMVRKLASAYDVPFSENAVRGSILSLLGGVLPASLGASASSLLKMLPGLGTIAGSAGVVVLAGASTYAVGQVFDRHLAYGGTLLDFDVQKARNLFRRKFEEGKDVATDLEEDSSSDKAA